MGENVEGDTGDGDESGGFAGAVEAGGYDEFSDSDDGGCLLDRA